MARHKTKTCSSNRKLKRGTRDVKRRQRDADQVYEDLQHDVSIPVDYDLTGAGQFYCASCARHFINSTTLKLHHSTKRHIRRLKEVQKKPWTQGMANLAAEKTQ
ncbi:putative bud site selection protein [Cardiosporidium cionae]|uniref:Bud site selection protein n=1 Tax=Cardiosporidium cionae TaxID=476202 RepID=A0ABQ7J982_9APIC|nr:putative bud site selection protein [Cardiosporidium cionae]|eukprot:KAF8820558.1 putative bud site selection protein [Cardiosporidium cionae]